MRVHDRSVDGLYISVRLGCLFVRLAVIDMCTYSGAYAVRVAHYRNLGPVCSLTSGKGAMDRPDDTISDNIEVVPVVVVSQTFPARPSAIPDIRDFVRACLAQSPLSEQDTREVGETVSRALLEAAGPTGASSVSL